MIKPKLKAPSSQAMPFAIRMKLGLHITMIKPLLIGLGYEFQCVDQLDYEEWDVPLDRVVTEERVYLMV